MGNTSPFTRQAGVRPDTMAAANPPLETVWHDDIQPLSAGKDRLRIVFIVRRMLRDFLGKSDLLQMPKERGLWEGTAELIESGRRMLIVRLPPAIESLV